MINSLFPIFIHPRLSSLARFNKAINTKAFYRTLKSGIKVLVSPHSRRGKYMRAVAALESIRKKPIEHGFLINNKTGKVSQEVEGEPTRIDVHGGLGMKPEVRNEMMDKQNGKMTTILHNHPSFPSPLSPGDYASGNPIVAIDTRGNMYRGQSKLKRPNQRKAAEALHNDMISIMDTTALATIGRKSPRGKRLPYNTHHFLKQHYANKRMAKAGAQTYRYKLTSATQLADRVHGSMYEKMAEDAFRGAYEKSRRKGLTLVGSVRAPDGFKYNG